MDYERALRSLDPCSQNTKRPFQRLPFLYCRDDRFAKRVVHEIGAFSSYFIVQLSFRYGLGPPTQIEEYRELLTEINGSVVSLPACPLMHETGSWLGCFYRC